MESISNQKTNNEILKLQAEFCTIFSNERRIMILCLLEENERKSVGELAKELNMPSQVVSQHLRLMKDKGAVFAVKEGKQIFYQIANPKFIEGCQKIREGLIEEILKKSKSIS